MEFGGLRAAVPSAAKALAEGNALWEATDPKATCNALLPNLTGMPWSTYERLSARYDP
jgi:hypothetical protein